MWCSPTELRARIFRRYGIPTGSYSNLDEATLPKKKAPRERGLLYASGMRYLPVPLEPLYVGEPGTVDSV